MKHRCFFVFIFSLACPGLLFAQKPERELPKPPPFHEEAGTSGPAIGVPPGGIRQVREFIRYVIRRTPDIGTDDTAQQRFLSKDMRRAFANRRAVYAEYVKNNETPDLPPGNSDFVGSWDYPTSFRIVGSRLYGQRAVIDVLFTWGKNTNYEGDTRLTTYCLVKEDSWKVDDIYSFRGKFVTANSLISNFSSTTY